MINNHQQLSYFFSSQPQNICQSSAPNSASDGWGRNTLHSCGAWHDGAERGNHWKVNSAEAEGSLRVFVERERSNIALKSMLPVGVSTNSFRIKQFVIPIVKELIEIPTTWSSDLLTLWQDMISWWFGSAICMCTVSGVNSLSRSLQFPFVYPPTKKTAVQHELTLRGATAEERVSWIELR